MAKLLSNTRIYGTGTVDTQLFVHGFLSAHNTSSGSLQVSGGIGVSGGGFFGGTVTATNFVGSVSGASGSLAGGTAGQVPYQVSPSVTGFFGPGTAGQILVSAGAAAPVYTNTASIYVQDAVNATNIRGGLANQFHIQSSPGVTTFISTANIYVNRSVLADNVAGGLANQFVYQTAPNTSAFISTGSMYVGRAVVADSVTGGSGQINTVAQTGNASYFLTFVDSNNSSAAAENVFTTSSFVVNAASGFVGLGIASPTERLELSAAADAARIKITNGVAGRSSILGQGASGFYWQPTNNGDIFELRNASGAGLAALNPNTANFGIGTTGPSEKLHVAGSTGDTRIRVSADDGTNYRGFEIRAGTTFKGGLFYRTTEGNVLQIWGTQASTSAINIDVNNMVRVMATTSVHNATSGAFQVAGGIGVAGGGFFGGTVTATNFVGAISGSSGQVSTVQATAAASHFLTFVDSNNPSAAAETVYTTSSFTINPGTGNVGIGTASPSQKLSVVGQTQSTSFALANGWNITDGGSGYAAISNWVGMNGTGIYTAGNTFTDLDSSTSAYEVRGFNNDTIARYENTNTGNADRRISFLPNGGNFSLGTTSPYSRFTMVTDAATNGMSMFTSAYISAQTWGTRIWKTDTGGGIPLQIDTQFASTWYTSLRISHGQDNNHPSLRSYYITQLATDAGTVIAGGTSPFTTGGTAKLSVIDNSVAISVGASNSDLMYVRRLSAGNYQFQTSTSSPGDNTGNIHIQPYGGNVGIGNTGPAAKLHVAASTPTSIGAVPSGTTGIFDSSTNNYLLFRNTADNATYSGIVMQDNNIGGYVVFGNAGGAGDNIYIAGYNGGELEYGTNSSVNPASRTTVASWNATGLQVNNGDFRASIFYDIVSTGYFVDPASNTNLSTLSLGGKRITTEVTNNTINSMNPLWSWFKPVGDKLYIDEQFDDGLNGIAVYNNNGGTAVTHTRRNTGFADATAAQPPNASGFVIEIMHAPTTSLGTSPGYGGWYFATSTGAGRRFVCTFKMKIPVGRNIEFHSNSIGTSGVSGWLTNNAGTGLYEDYAYYVDSGTASWSSTFFFAVSGGSNATFYTYLASATVYEVSDMGIERARTYVSNFLGVGGITPTARLDISGDSIQNVGLLRAVNTYASGGTYYPTARFVQSRGNHSYGIVAEFRIDNASDTDRPSILFTSAQSAVSWQLGQVTSGWGTDNNFAIGYRASSTPGSFSAWPTPYFTITTSGNVGIGDTDPSQKLVVSGAAVVTGGIYGAETGAPDATIWAISGQYTDWGIFYNEGSPDYIEFKTAGTVASRIALDTGAAHFALSGGSVGIGIASPSTKLHLWNTDADCEFRITADNTGGTEYDPVIRLTGQSNSLGEGFRLWYDNSVGDTYFDNVWPSGSATNPAIRFRTTTAGTPVNALTITHNGNVGIDNVNPSQKLDVTGSIRASSQLISTVATGTAPLSVASTTLVTNLNADFVDGLSSGAFMRSAGTENPGTIIIRDNRSVTNYYSTVALEIRSSDQKAIIGLHRDGFSHCGIAHETINQLRFNFNSGDVYLNHNTGTIWGSGNDGAGSGLDADLLDGIDSSGFVRARTRSNWNDATVINNVIGQLAWKNYGNGHTIFDASASTSPDGTSINNTNAAVAWTGSYPTLMGWNGSSTYGVRVDSARVADSADQIDGWPFRNTGSNSGVNADTIDSNGITYYTSGVINFSGNSTDGALYSQSYSTNWQHQIAGDYREGNIAVRGKNNGTWARWKPIPTLTISDTAPANETPCDLWWESDTGKLKIYYNDGSSSQWVDAMPIPDMSTYFSKGGGGISGSVTIAGTLHVTGQIFSENEITAFYSDARLKTVSGRISGALDKVMQLGGYYYTANDLAEQYGYKNKTEKVGVLAQEVEKVLPQAVALAGFDTEIDEQGNTKSKSGENYKTVYYDKLVPLLIEAIKEQQEQIEMLKNKVNKLEGLN